MKEIAYFFILFIHLNDALELSCNSVCQCSIGVFKEGSEQLEATVECKFDDQKEVSNV